jgi:hypothetical protein
MESAAMISTTAVIAFSAVEPTGVSVPRFMTAYESMHRRARVRIIWIVAITANRLGAYRHSHRNLRRVRATRGQEQNPK